jgi:hypothetical protein
MSASVRFLAPAVAAAALAASGCPWGTKCGSRTLEVQGRCVGAAPTVCGSGTVARTDAAGQVVCVAGLCSDPIACPAPGAGEAALCGRIVDLASGAPVEAADAATAPCGAPAADGPCALAVRAYDALDFVTSPSAATPIATDVLLDDCGRFRVVAPVNAYAGVALAVDDAGAAAGHVLSAAIVPVNGGTARRTTAYAVDAASDAAWTASAGLSGQTFSELGAFVPIFVDPRTQDRVAGVTITVNGAADPAHDWYFADAGATLGALQPSLAVTGADGAGILTGSPLGPHSGTGGEPVQCTWPSVVAGSIPGAYLVQELDAVCP